MTKKHALVIGASGATGLELVKLLLKNSNFFKVSVFLRKDIELKNEKLVVHKINFLDLKKYKNLIQGDILFSALGTTKKDAGSKTKQFLVDFTYQYEIAKIASENNVENYSLVSSVGANENSFFFYPKMKGQLEEAVKNLHFKKIQIFQPPSLIRQSHLVRKSEKVVVKLFQIVNKIGLLKSLTPLSVKDLATKMINESLKQNNKRLQVFQRADF